MEGRSTDVPFLSEGGSLYKKGSMIIMRGGSKKIKPKSGEEE